MTEFSKQNRFYRALFLIVLIAVLVIALLLIQDAVQKQKNQQLQEELRELYHGSETTTTLPTQTSAIPTTTIRPTQTTVPEPQLLPRFVDLLEINPDTVGWIRIPETVIDYPVVQYEDNAYYLERDFNQNYAKAGTLFMDFRMKLDETDRHEIIYGHHMRDGSMFTGLIKYKSQDFFDAHRFVYLDKLYHQETWEIFSAYVTDVEFYFIETNFADDQAWLDFIRLLQEKSTFQTDVALTAQDRVLTLVTCTYEFDNARYVVHARRIA